MPDNNSKGVADDLVVKVSSNFKVYSFSKKHKPVLRVKPGTVIIFEVKDCFDDQLNLNTEEPLNIEAVDKSRVNPATGPVWIDGAMPGQTLEVEILDVKVSEKGFISRKVFKIADGKIEMDSLRIPIKPLIGVIGVAPSRGKVSTKAPGNHGGNLDTPEVCAGSKVFIPIWVEGGLLAMGDVHAVQGDGEVSGQGLEVSAEVKVRVKLHPSRVLDEVLVDTGSDLVVLASSESLEDAVKKALKAAQTLLQKSLGLSERDALILLSLTSNLGISQIVNPLKTAKVKIPKNIIPVRLENLLKKSTRAQRVR